MKVAALQMVSNNCLDDNFNQASQLIDRAAQAGVELCLLPENFACFSIKPFLKDGSISEVLERVRAFLSEQARMSGVSLIAGSVPMNEPTASGRMPATGKVFTSSLVYLADGREAARYDKLHLFDVDVGDQQGSYRESDQFAAGDEVVVANLSSAKVGLSICYDLRFAELYRALSERGADILVVPAAFTYKTGEAHWFTLLRARAIENQCFVIAANQGGDHGRGRQTWGHSVIISPWGDVLAECEMGVEAVIADLDLSSLSSLRAAMPVAQHRRRDVDF
jgi:predicted amidohydrolase